jgi:hypothetical protein
LFGWYLNQSFICSTLDLIEACDQREEEKPANCGLQHSCKGVSTSLRRYGMEHLIPGGVKEMTESFIPPEFWSFPPFFTSEILPYLYIFIFSSQLAQLSSDPSRIQPVQITRQKQLDLWKDLLLEYHMKRNIHSMTLAEFPYFENQTINRKLNREGVVAVIQHMIALGEC